jgi:hypothetical protein
MICYVFENINYLKTFIYLSLIQMFEVINNDAIFVLYLNRNTTEEDR